MSTFTEMALQSAYLAPKMQQFQRLLIDAFGINYFFYSYVSQEKRCYFVGSNPDLVAHYASENMFQHNPFFTCSDQMTSGLYFYQSVREEAFQTSMTDIENKYNAKHVLLLVRRESNGVHYYGFAQKPKMKSIDSLLVNHIPLLKKFSSYYESEMHNYFLSLQDQSVDLAIELKKPTVADAINSHLTHKTISRFLEKTSNPNLVNIRFSRREREVIEHMLKGKSAPHIAKDINLSSRTVEYYITLIKNKCGVFSKAELIEFLNEFVTLYL